MQHNPIDYHTTHRDVVEAMFISHAIFLLHKQYLLFKVHCQGDAHNVVFFLLSPGNGRCRILLLLQGGFKEAILWAAATRSGHMVQERDTRICICTLWSMARIRSLMVGSRGLSRACGVI